MSSVGGGERGEQGKVESGFLEITRPGSSNYGVNGKAGDGLAEQGAGELVPARGDADVWRALEGSLRA